MTLMTDQITARKLRGVIPALITPMEDNGNIDYNSLEKQIAYLCQADITGLFVNGTTGEGAYLSTSKKVEVLNVVGSVAAKDMILCAACIKPSTIEVIDEVTAFEKVEVDFLVAVTPYYAKVSQEVVLMHFKEIAASASIPLIIYNIPQNTNNPIEFKTIEELIRVENIAGIKDSSGNFINFSRGILCTPISNFVWIQGEDLLDAAAYLLGATAAVTGLGNVWIDPYVAMRQSANQGDMIGVLDAQKKINALVEIVECAPGKGISAIKAACSLLGRSKPGMSIPSLRLNAEELTKIKRIVEDLQLV
jgi:4-hydroxy-tetrahydrodipicolinate synthase